jgi:dTMP kinase
MFATFEGNEYVGKTVQVELLANRLRRQKVDPVVIREPGGTSIGEECRNILKHSVAGANMCPETELLLMNASRAQLVREVIGPALTEGKVVICDRFADSSWVYQGHGRGLPMNHVEAIISFATIGLAPDITFLLVAPHADREARQVERMSKMPFKPDRFEAADKDFFLRVDQGYAALAERDKHRVVIIDASKGIQDVHEAIWALFSKRWLDLAGHSTMSSMGLDPQA